MGRYGFPDSIEGLFFHKPVPCHFIDRSDQMISDEYQMISNEFKCYQMLLLVIFLWQQNG